MDAAAREAELEGALATAQHLLAQGQPRDAHAVLAAVLPAPGSLGYDALGHEGMIRCQHLLGVALHMDEQVELAVARYAQAEEACKCVVEGVSHLHLLVLRSLANCWQGPLNNSLKAAQYRRALLKLLGRESAGLECSICLEELAEQQPQWVMPCNHLFHLECIRKWHDESRSVSPQLACPECRQACGDLESPVSKYAHCIINPPYEITPYRSLYEAVPTSDATTGGDYQPTEYQTADYQTSDYQPANYHSGYEYQVQDYEVQEYRPATEYGTRIT